MTQNNFIAIRNVSGGIYMRECDKFLDVLCENEFILEKVDSYKLVSVSS